MKKLTVALVSGLLTLGLVAPTLAAPQTQAQAQRIQPSHKVQKVNSKKAKSVKQKQAKKVKKMAHKKTAK